MIKAVIFDIDGTLVNSVDLHAKAWQEAFAHFGHKVAFEDVRSQIGKGGDQLMPMFLSKTEIDRQGPEIEKYCSDLFKERYLPQVRAFPAVRDLIKRIIHNGQRIALGSSAKGDELSTYKKISRIEDLIDKETSSDDAFRSKPHPDIFEAALKKLGLEANEAIVVGNSPYDAEAAGKLGLRTLAVLCGGFLEADLRTAGCIAIYRDPADMLMRFDQSLLVEEVPPPAPASNIKRPLALALGCALVAAATLLLCRRPD